MGVTFYHNAKEVAESSSLVGFCFVDQLRSLERLIEMPCGVSPALADEIHIDAAQFEEFISKLVVRLEQTNNGQLAALCVGCLQICLLLQNTITGEWRQLPPRLMPLLEGSKALETVDWKIIALQADEEELALRQGAPRSNRDWVVYRRTTDEGPEQAARRRDSEQRNIGLSLLMQKRYVEAADFFRGYSKQSDSKEWSYLLGMVLNEGGSSAEARAAFEQAAYCEPGKEISKREQIYVVASQKRISEIDHPTNVS